MSKKKSKHDTNKESKVRFKKTGKAKKNTQRKARYDDKRVIRDMIHNCDPDEYDEFGDYIGWNDN